MTERYVDGFEVLALNPNIRTNIGVKNLDKTADGSFAVGIIPEAVRPYIVAAEYGDESFHKTVLTCTALPLSIADAAAVCQYGGVQVYTFPKGVICSFGASILGSLTLGVTGTIINTFTGVNALGTVTPAGDAALTATEATWLQSTANAAAVAKVAAIKAFSIASALIETSARVVDGSVTAAPVWLNFAIADDASHTAGTGAFTGVITICWCNLNGV